MTTSHINRSLVAFVQFGFSFSYLFLGRSVSSKYILRSPPLTNVETEG